MKKKSRSKKTEKSNDYKGLREKYKLLSAFMDNTPDVIYFKNKQGRLELVNKAHAKGLGLEPEDVAGKTDFDIFSKEKARKMAKDDEYVVKTGKPIIDKVERATRADGVDNYVSTTKVPRYDEKGRVVGLIGITRDITKRIQFERLREEKRNIEEKLRAFEELNKMESAFVTAVSHELRTPLAIIKEMILLLDDEVPGGINEKQKKVLSAARDNIKRLEGLVESLLDASRIEQGKFRLHYSLVNLGDLIKDSSGYFKRLAQSKGIELKYKLPKNRINVFADTERINQVFSNLITNAIKFTEEHGKIRVEVKILESRVRIGIMDTGIGISKKDLSKLFDRFVQVSRLPDAQNKGVGLGLFIVKELVEKHGGEIWAESKLGVGSKFYFTIPRFQTTEVLEAPTRKRINTLIEKGATVHFINLLIVNYKEFKRRIKITPHRLFKDVKVIIEDTLNEFHWTKEKPQMAMMDTKRGECNILLPGVRENKANKFCDNLKDKLGSYFIENKLRGVFINLGIFRYPDKSKVQRVEGIPARFLVKEIYIGSEKRRFRRFLYKADINVFSPKEKKGLAKTIDISEGGMCLLTDRPLETNEKIKISLKFPKRKDTLFLKARIAWIKKIEPMPKGVDKYKIGLEFIALNNKDKKKFVSFIKSLSKGA